ncbi:MAG: S9 family peptidase [Chloroflexi bacterium]|nr:S9 family peptidase [Chloroflexota bacterium]
MPPPQVAPYGSWKSPITPDLIAAGTISFGHGGQIALDGEDIYWVEMRPAENGRSVVVRRTPDGQTADVTPPPFNARTRVHEYGGGAFAVAGGTVYFSNFDDQRLYRQIPGSSPEPLTPAADLRYADAVVDRRRNRLICVREDHTAGGHEPANTLVGVTLDGGDTGRVLVAGNDFFASPRLSPNGSRLAWLTWNHPNMPWDGTELWIGEVAADGSVGRAARIAGGVAESVTQPEWSPDGALSFVSDRTGWWNLYRWQHGSVEPLCEMPAEFAVPQWVFGLSSYAFVSAGRIVCTYGERGIWRLAWLDTATRQIDPIETPFDDIRALRATSGHVVFNGASPTAAAAIVRLDLATHRIDVLRRAGDAPIDPGYLSVPRAIEFPTEDGRTAHGFFYPPQNRGYVAPAGERPPLLVVSHGGPTSATTTALRLEIQYWTSRGIAVLDVNYGGSTGYGRAYRQRLNGRWGVVDVDDSVNGARWHVERGELDGDRLAIRGGSAGGYTTLSALTFRDVFAAGASHFGVADLELLAKETHKFESRYLDTLIGPYPARRDLYVARSPIHFTDRLTCPVIFFQGLDDKIVPPNQAELMVAALRAQGIPVAYLPFAGESHGFRRADTIKRALEAELYFYARVFGFALAEPVEPVPIENLAAT